jgi:AraC-like DNA-binding protein
MKDNVFSYYLSKNTLVFTDTLTKNAPYIARKPRNHESLFFVTNGALLYQKGNEKTVIKKGQVGYIGRGSVDISSAYLCDAVSYIAVNFSLDSETDLSQVPLPFHTLCANDDSHQYEKLFKAALHCFLSRTPGYMPLCNSYILNVIGLLYNEHTMDRAQFSKKQQIEPAVEYLSRNYMNADLKISSLYDIVYMSEKNFRRLFFAVYNQTPYAYLQKLRINNAEILLLNTSKNISDIALQCGFCDVYTFSHAFKKNTGISPSKYRLLNR